MEHERICRNQIIKIEREREREKVKINEITFDPWRQEQKNISEDFCLSNLTYFNKYVSISWLFEIKGMWIRCPAIQINKLSSKLEAYRTWIYAVNRKQILNCCTGTVDNKSADCLSWSICELRFIGLLNLPMYCTSDLTINCLSMNGVILPHFAFSLQSRLPSLSNNPLISSFPLIFLLLSNFPFHLFILTLGRLLILLGL